jgi:hypothetical protein
MPYHDLNVLRAHLTNQSMILILSSQFTVHFSLLTTTPPITSCSRAALEAVCLNSCELIWLSPSRCQREQLCLNTFRVAARPKPFQASKLQFGELPVISSANYWQGAILRPLAFSLDPTVYGHKRSPSSAFSLALGPPADSTPGIDGAASSIPTCRSLPGWKLLYVVDRYRKPSAFSSGVTFQATQRSDPRKRCRRVREISQDILVSQNDARRQTRITLNILMLPAALVYPSESMLRLC